MSEAHMHDDHRQRMRARIEKNGILSLQDHEILEYLLYPFVPRKDTNPIAHKLIDKFGSFRAVLGADAKALKTVHNMTDKAALFLSTLSDIARKFCADEGEEREKVDTYERAVNYLSAQLKNCENEKIVAIFIDQNGRLKHKCELGTGTETDCRLQVNELVMLTQNFRCNYVYIAHNHPHGMARPSFSDVEFTKWAVAALEVLGVRLLDHIIIAGDEVYSFKKDGDLERFKSSYVDFVTNGNLAADPRKGK